jgi:TatA/E family protein of Tat protein translocase
MFGMGISEILVVLVIALIVIGPAKLPEIAKSLGKAMGEFKRATNELKDTIKVPDPPRSYTPIGISKKAPVAKTDAPASETPEKRSSEPTISSEEAGKENHDRT